MIIEIFRADSDQRIDFYTEKITVPIELIEKSLEIFNKRIGKELKVISDKITKHGDINDNS